MKYVLALFFILSIYGCGNGSNFMNGENPRKKSFKYFDKAFRFDEGSGLQLEKKYLKLEDSEPVHILFFFKDGFLNFHYTNSIDGVSATRRESGQIMGYYKTIKDSILFTTKSYYQHSATNYAGKIKGDTIELLVYHPKSKMPSLEKYAKTRDQ